MGEGMIDWAARETRMRRGEVYHTLRVPDDCYIVMRVDGRSFHTYSREKEFERPFGSRFHEHMLRVGEALVDGFHAPLAYTESDECSVVFGPEWDLQGRS